MKNVGYRAESLSPFDLQGAEDHLSAMAAQGWRLERIGRFFWKYRGAEPARIRYAVTCPPAAGENGEIGERLFFEELCAAAGWEKVTEWAELQIYANEGENPTPLETDEALRLEVVHQSMRRTFLRTRRSNLICVLLLLILQFCDLLKSPRTFFLSNISLGIVVSCLLMMLVNAASIAEYCVWRRRSLRSVEEGGGPAAVPRSYKVLCRLSSVLLVLLFAALILMTLLPDEFRRLLRFDRPTLFGALGAVLGTALGYVIKRSPRWKKMEWQTRAAAIILGLLAFLAVGTGIAGFLSSPQRPQPAATSYAWNGQEWDLEPQALPLTIEDLTGQPWPHVRRTVRSEGRTIFASGTACTERAAQENGEEAYLHYIVLDIPSETVLRAILNDMRDAPAAMRYQPEPPAPWGAETAYRLYYPNGQPTDEWLLCWPDRIVALYAEGIPFGNEQKADVYAHLSAKEAVT